MKKYTTSYSLFLIVFFVGFFCGWLLFKGDRIAILYERDNHSSKEEVWTCSMHQQIKQIEHGDCSICGMKLIPFTKSEEEQNNTYISLSKSAVALANIQTTKVIKSPPKKELFLQGKITVDKRRTYSQTSYYSGRIEKTYVNYLGEKVIKGQKLATIYSPQLVTAQREYFEAKKIKDLNPQLFLAATEKLKLLKLSEEQINTIDESGKVMTTFDIRSDISGVITKLNIVEGNRVTEGRIMYDIVELSRLLVKFDAYESDLAWLKFGDKIFFSVPSFPEQKFSTYISFLDPIIDPETHVATIRGNIVNKGGMLKPGMFASGIVNAVLPIEEDVIVVPKSAVLWTGPRSIVYIKVIESDEPTFEMREVILGPSLTNEYIITEGLEVGEEVVTQGTYMIDASAQLKGK